MEDTQRVLCKMARDLNQGISGKYSILKIFHHPKKVKSCRLKIKSVFSEPQTLKNPSMQPHFHNPKHTT